MLITNHQAHVRDVASPRTRTTLDHTRESQSRGSRPETSWRARTGPFRSGRRPARHHRQCCSTRKTMSACGRGEQRVTAAALASSCQACSCGGADSVTGDGARATASSAPTQAGFFSLSVPETCARKGWPRSQRRWRGTAAWMPRILGRPRHPLSPSLSWAAAPCPSFPWGAWLLQRTCPCQFQGGVDTN